MYLLFVRCLDDLQMLEKNKGIHLGQPIQHNVVHEGNEQIGRPYDDLRWSRFRHFAPAET